MRITSWLRKHVYSYGQLMPTFKWWPGFAIPLIYHLDLMLSRDKSGNVTSQSESLEPEGAYQVTEYKKDVLKNANTAYVPFNKDHLITDEIQCIIDGWSPSSNYR